MDVEFTAEVTGLSVEEVLQIRSRLDRIIAMLEQLLQMTESMNAQLRSWNNRD
jgi:hypothetical protein